MFTTTDFPESKMPALSSVPDGLHTFPEFKAKHQLTIDRAANMV